MPMDDFKEVAKDKFAQQIADYIEAWIDSSDADEFIDDVFNEIDMEDPTDKQYVDAQKYVLKLLEKFQASIKEQS